MSTNLTKKLKLRVPGCVQQIAMLCVANKKMKYESIKGDEFSETSSFLSQTFSNSDLMQIEIYPKGHRINSNKLQQSVITKQCKKKLLKNTMSNKPSKYLRNGPGNLNDERKKGPQKLRVILNRMSKRKHKKKLKRSRKRRLIGKKKGIFLKNTSVKNIH